MSTSPIAGRAAAAPRRITLPSLLVPALGDLLLIAIVFWLFCAAPESWNHFLGDANTGLHIRTGDYVLDHGQVPRTDLYSFSKPGGQWFAFEWLSCLIYAALHRVSGLAGVAFISALVLIAWPMIQLRDSIWRGANSLIALILMFAGIRAAGIHFLARPHLFTMLLAAITVALIARERAQPTRRVWLLLPLAVLWTNLHGGFLVLPAYLALLAAGLLLEGRIRDARRWGLVFAGCCGATLINPYGFALHRHIAGFLGSKWLARMVQEYAPARTFRGDGHVETFILLLAIGSAVATAMLMRRRFVEPLWIAFFGYMAVSSARHITIFVIIAIPVIACELTRWFDAIGGTVPGVLNEMARDIAPSVRKVTPWGAAAAILILLSGVPSHWPPSFPAGMVERDAAVLTGSRLFTTDHWGDYLIYRLWPRQRVFVDGRSDYFGERIGLEYLTMFETEPGWRPLFDSWKFNAALVPANANIGKALLRDPDWRVADTDREAVLLVRRPATSPPPPASAPGR